MQNDGLGLKTAFKSFCSQMGNELTVYHPPRQELHQIKDNSFLPKAHWQENNPGESVTQRGRRLARLRKRLRVAQTS